MTVSVIKAMFNYVARETGMIPEPNLDSELVSPSKRPVSLQWRRMWRHLFPFHPPSAAPSTLGWEGARRSACVRGRRAVACPVPPPPSVSADAVVSRGGRPAGRGAATTHARPPWADGCRHSPERCVGRELRGRGGTGVSREV